MILKLRVAGLCLSVCGVHTGTQWSLGLPFRGLSGLIGGAIIGVCKEDKSQQETRVLCLLIYFVVLNIVKTQ